MTDTTSYSGYFTSRGVTPLTYENTKLPQYIIESIGYNKDVAILDVGCGFGQNIMACKREGYHNVMGIDISDQAIAYCLGKQLNVIKCDVLNYNKASFDFILMSHILEHIAKEKIISTLKHIKDNLLKENGKLFILVPNAMSNTDCYWAYEDFTHNTLFTPGSLLFVLRESGFSNIQFIDPEGLACTSGMKKYIKKILLNLYKANKTFWNKVTGSAYHAPSPRIFTWELKCLALND